MRSPLFFVSLVVLLVVPTGVGATLPEEHPEWFGYTAPLGVDASWAGGWTRTWIAPVPGSVHQASLVAALAEHSDLTILAQGDEDHLALYEWLSDEGLSPKDMGWMDVTSLETRAAGEWGPFVLTSPEGNLLLDGRYYALRPNDDAAAGRLAEAEAAPLQRAPLFLSRSHLQGRSDGLCLAGPEIWNMNLGFTAAEITHTLHAWAGCQVLLSVPAPSADFKKRPMELYVRLEEQGVLLADSSGWSASLQLGLEEIRAVLEAAAASSPLTIHEVPWPADLDGATRSYLALVPLADAVIVPTYSGTSATESEALDVLAAFWPDRTLVTVPADAAAPLDQWPSHLVMGAAPGTWADLPSAEILCEGASPADCDLCLDECAPRAPVCTETPEGLAALDSCQAGADGCLDLVVVPCGQAQLCKDGACEDAPTTCDTLPVGGTCQGSVLVRCIAGQVVQVDCAQDGKLCAWEEDGTAACFLPCENPCDPPGMTVCGEDGLSILTCEQGPEGCPEWIGAPCPEGQVCAGDACGAPPVDAAEGRSDVADPGLGEDGGTVNAGYGAASGCGASTRGREGGGWLLLGMALCLAIRDRRRDRTIPRPPGASCSSR